MATLAFSRKNLRSTFVNFSKKKRKDSGNRFFSCEIVSWQKWVVGNTIWSPKVVNLLFPDIPFLFRLFDKTSSPNLCSLVFRKINYIRLIRSVFIFKLFKVEINWQRLNDATYSNILGPVSIKGLRFGCIPCYKSYHLISLGPSLNKNPYIQVLHHLEQDPDGKSFPNVAQSLKEVYRILKPGEVLTIISVTPEQLDAKWFCKVGWWQTAVTLLHRFSIKIVLSHPTFLNHTHCLFNRW